METVISSQRVRAAVVFFLFLISSMMNPRVVLGQEKPQTGPYETGLYHLLSGEVEKALEEFRKAAMGRGEKSDLARIQIIGIQASRGKDVSEIEKEIQSIKDPVLSGAGRVRAVREYRGNGHEDLALQIAMNYLSIADPSEKLERIHFELALIRTRRKHYSTAISHLFSILEDPDSTMKKDALHLLATIYLTPGPYYHPERAKAAIQQFEVLSEKREVEESKSVWYESVRELKRMIQKHSGPGLGR